MPTEAKIESAISELPHTPQPPQPQLLQPNAGTASYELQASMAWALGFGVSGVRNGDVLIDDNGASSLLRLRKTIIRNIP